MATGVSSVSLFAPQLADVERQRQMAELLQQQANAPYEIQSYKGIQAPIPTTAVLAKALEGYMAGRKRRKADTEEKTLRQKEEDIRTSEAAAADEAYRTGVYTPPQIDKTAPTDANMAPPSRTMQLAKALGLGDVANRVRGLIPGQAAAPQGNLAAALGGTSAPVPGEAGLNMAPPAAPPMVQPAMPQPAMPPATQSGASVNAGIPSAPTAGAPSAPAMGIAPGTPPVVQKPAPTLQDRQQAYYQALSHSRDPSVAASARDHLMQLEERQATNQAITGAMRGAPGGDRLAALINAGVSPGDAADMLGAVTPKSQPLHFFQSGANVIGLNDDGEMISNTKMDVPAGARPFTEDDRKGFKIGPNVPGYVDKNGDPHILTMPRPAGTGDSTPDDLSGIEAALRARGLL